MNLLLNSELYLYILKLKNINITVCTSTGRQPRSFFYPKANFLHNFFCWYPKNDWIYLTCWLLVVFWVQLRRIHSLLIHGIIVKQDWWRSMCIFTQLWLLTCNWIVLKRKQLSELVKQIYLVNFLTHSVTRHILSSVLPSTWFLNIQI